MFILTPRPLGKVVLDTQSLHLHTPTTTTLLHLQRLALVIPLIAPKGIPSLDGAIGRDVEAHGLEARCGTENIDEVGLWEGDIAEDKGVDGGERCGVALGERGERGVGRGGEGEGVGCRGEVEGEVEGECRWEQRQEREEFHCGGEMSCRVYWWLRWEVVEVEAVARDHGDRWQDLEMEHYLIGTSACCHQSQVLSRLTCVVKLHH